MSRDPAGDRAPLRQVALRAITRYRELEMTDRAASLTYYAMLSLFPGLLVLVTLLGIFGERRVVTDIVDYVSRHGADSTTAAALREALDRLIRTSQGALGVTLGVSVLLGINGASGAFAASGRALNVIFGVEERRGFARRKLADVGMTLVVLGLLVLVLIAVFLGGGVVDDIAGAIGLGHAGAVVWGIARWPLALAGAMLAFTLVYAYAPDIRPPRLRWVSPGATFGVVLWIVASLGFAVYIRNFSKYGTAYGAFGAAIVLLLWLYISANAFLFGAQLNAELDHEKLTASQPPRGGDR